MSSVMRSIKQTPSNFFWCHGADIWTLDAIKASFRGEGAGSYSGPEPIYRGNLILFDTEEHFAEATYELLDNNGTYYADGYTTQTDMGKNIYIGVVGGESSMLTMSLIKIKSSTNDDGGDPADIGKTGYGLTAMNLPAAIAADWDNDVDVNLIRGGV